MKYKMKGNKKMEFSQLKSKAKQSLNGKWGTVIAAVIVESLIIGALSSCGLSILVVGPLSVGMAAIMLNAIRGKEVQFDNLFDGFKDFGGNLVLGLLYNLFIALWSLLFFIPGIIKSYSWALVFYMKKDHPELTWKEALDKSASWMYGHKWELFCLDLSFIGWILLSVLTCGLLVFWLAPYMAATRAQYYEELKKLNEPTSDDSNPMSAAEDILASIGL